MAITKEELTSIVNSVLSALATNSKTIDQLTSITDLGDDDFFEVNGGKKVSYGLISKLQKDYTNENFAKKDLSNLDMDKYFRTEVDSEESVTKAGDAGDASWLETRWDETTFDGESEAVSRRQVRLGNSAIGVTSDGRAYVEREGTCKTLPTEENLVDYAKKDLSNVFDYVIRDKAGLYEILEGHCSIDKDHSVWFSNGSDAAGLVGATAEDGEKTLYFTSSGSFPDMGYAISPVSAKIVYGRESLSYVATFVGVDDYVHKVVWDEEGNLTKQYAYSLDDFATKQDLEELEPGDLTSKGYLPTRIVDMGEYSSSEGFDFNEPLLAELASAMRAVSEGKATLLLKASTSYGDPLFFSGVSVRIDAGIDYRMTFLMSNGNSYWISFEAGYPDSVSQGFVESGSGTITSEAYTDKDYGEI